ncbi:hypothetical protein [Agrobacterium pusense]|uniref:hypothetical protein n=1 Tax=Agrobacterium pusense TaxID=648995 RepID=UPI0013AEAD46|nr:hypothetical protein [Agrobacterium pusense]
MGFTIVSILISCSNFIDISSFIPSDFGKITKIQENKGFFCFSGIYKFDGTQEEKIKQIDKLIPRKYGNNSEDYFGALSDDWSKISENSIETKVIMLGLNCVNSISLEKEAGILDKYSYSLNSFKDTALLVDWKLNHIIIVSQD